MAEALTKKVVAPSQRCEMAQCAVSQRNTSVTLACVAFYISQICDRYQAKLNAENERIADWLFGLTSEQRNCGFGFFTCAT